MPGWSARISTLPVPATGHQPTSTRRFSRPPRSTQGAQLNDTKSDAKPRREALGRSRGGLTTKIHLAADTRCRPLSRVTTAGHRHDCLAFESVMAGIRIRRRGRGRPRTRPGRVLGDKAYSNRAIRSHLRRRQIKATIPEPASQQAHRLRRASKGGRPPQFDAKIYKQRNVVERAINKLKSYRAVASRYDKRDYMYRGTIDIASIRIWLRDPVS
jgi:transposase